MRIRRTIFAILTAAGLAAGTAAVATTSAATSHAAAAIPDGYPYHW